MSLLKGKRGMTMMRLSFFLFIYIISLGQFVAVLMVDASAHIQDVRR